MTPHEQAVQQTNNAGRRTLIERGLTVTAVHSGPHSWFFCECTDAAGNRSAWELPYSNRAERASYHGTVDHLHKVLARINQSKRK